jgi:hypothetical protein
MRQLMPTPEKRAKPQLTAEMLKIFTDATRQFPGDFAKQAQHIVRAHRPAGLPESFQPLNMGLSDWKRFRQEQERQKQEAEARERAQQQYAEQQRLAHQREEQQWEEYRRTESLRRGKDSCDRLEQEVRNRQIDQIAENIANDWRQQAPGTPVSVSHIYEPHVMFKDDGTFEHDFSKAGRKVSYSHKAVETKSEEHPGGDEGSHWVEYKEEVTKTEELIFGIENAVFSSVNETRYFVNWEIVRLTDSGASGKFFEMLSKHAESLSPGKVIPPANLRVQAFMGTHEQPQKKGFWRRLFS